MWIKLKKPRRQNCFPNSPFYWSTEIYVQCSARGPGGRCITPVSSLIFLEHTQCWHWHRRKLQRTGARSEQEWLWASLDKQRRCAGTPPADPGSSLRPSVPHSFLIKSNTVFKGSLTFCWQRHLKNIHWKTFLGRICLHFAPSIIHI